MVDADVGGEPLKHRRHHVVRAPVQGGFVHLPVFLGLPMRGFELVLHVEQPHARSGSQQRTWQKDEKNWHQTAEINDCAERNEYSDVGEHRAEPEFALCHEAKRQAVFKKEEIAWPKSEHNDRVPIKAIVQSIPLRETVVLGHRKRVDVAHSTAVEIA